MEMKVLIILLVAILITTTSIAYAQYGGGTTIIPGSSTTITGSSTTPQKDIKITNIDPNLGIESINIKTLAPITAYKVTIYLLQDKPIGTGDIPQGTPLKYYYFLASISSIDKAEITFNIKKSEIGGNADLLVYRYVGGKWTLLESELEVKEDTFLVKATTPGFSYFALSYISKPVSEQIEQPNEFEVDVDGYSVKVVLNGIVKSIEPEPENLSLKISLDEIVEDTVVELALPRNVIDAKEADGSDKEFIILADGTIIKEFDEETLNDSRILRFVIESGTRNIEIIGTHVIPEFGVIAIIALAAATSIITVVSRTKSWN